MVKRSFVFFFRCVTWVPFGVNLLENHAEYMADSLPYARRKLDQTFDWRLIAILFLNQVLKIYRYMLTWFKINRVKRSRNYRFDWLNVLCKLKESIAVRA